MICPHCGTNIPQGHTVCPFCKAQAVRRAAPTQQKSEPTVSSLAEKSLQRKSRQQQKKKQQRRRALLFVVLLVLCIALVFGTSALIRHLSSISAEAELRWQEQYDLGSRYLSEGNYEAAVLAFRAAIDIDPKRPEPYLGAAEAYVALGDREAAEEILAEGDENTGEDLSEKLDAIIEELSSNTPEETLPAQGRKLVKIVQTDHYNGVSEVSMEYYLSYNENNQLSAVREVAPSAYDVTYEYIYDQEGRYIGYNINGTRWDVYTYDTEGKLIRWTDRVLEMNNEYTYHYDSHGILTSAEYTYPGFSPEMITYHCDEEGRISEEIWNSHSISYTYDEQGRISGKTSGNEDYSVLYTYDYENARPFAAEYQDGSCNALLFQDTVGHTIFNVFRNIYISGPMTLQCDEEGYILSAQEEYYTFTFYYDDDSEEAPTTATYTDILDMFYAGISSNWTNCDGENAENILDPDNVCYILPHYESSLSLSEVGYALKDINGDGQPELFIARANSADSGQFYDLYTIKGGEVIHVISAGERSHYKLAEDNSIIHFGSSGAAHSSRYNCYLAPSTGMLAINYALIGDWDRNNDQPYFYFAPANRDVPVYEVDYNALRHLSNSEAEEILNNLPADAPLELILFADYVHSSP